MPLCEQVELPSQRREAAGLDLDQQLAADEIDDEPIGRTLVAERCGGSAARAP
jgi:hypothetical protein